MHPQEILLVNADGTPTLDGQKLSVEAAQLSKAHLDAFLHQQERQFH